MAMALLGVLTILAVLAILAPAPQTAGAARGNTGDGAAPALALTALLAFVTMCIGAYVSSSYAGLACLTFPSCDGSLLGHNAAQLVQMLHRIAAGSFALIALIATWTSLSVSSPRVRTFAILGCALVFVQIVLGFANVAWQLPLALREAHAANAQLTFLMFVIAAVLAALEPVRATEPLPERAAATAQRIATNP